MRVSHSLLTVTIHQKDSLRKATSSLFPIKMIAKQLEGHTITKQGPDTDPPQTMGATINNKSTTAEQLP